AAPHASPPDAAAPGATSLDLASAEQTIAAPGPGRAAGAAGAGASASDAQAAPTTPQPVQRHEQPYDGWDHGAGYAAGSQVRPEETPRPDFSSWYGPSPGSAAADPPGGGTVPWYRPASGPGSPSGRGSVSGPGSASGPGSVSWSGGERDHAPPRRRRSRLGWKGAVVLLALLGAVAGAATVVLLRHYHFGASAPSAGTTLPPANLITAINQPLTGAAPAGYRSYRKPASPGEHAGFSINIPANWITSANGPHQTYLTYPGTHINMVVDLTPHTYPDMVQEARYIESQSIPRFPGYQRADLSALTIRGTPGAFWKFAWLRAGVPQTALDLLFVLSTPAGQQSYALYATAPSSLWLRMRPVFDEELRSFAPLSG
ncbi:MAG: hypothetical protein JO037_08360, partial [Actinobacteria bacterium]|nr:hypothetical protein [Actinomycetota bacterium]